MAEIASIKIEADVDVRIAGALIFTTDRLYKKDDMETLKSMIDAAMPDEKIIVLPQGMKLAYYDLENVEDRVERITE